MSRNAAARVARKMLQRDAEIEMVDVATTLAFLAASTWKEYLALLEESLDAY